MGRKPKPKVTLSEAVLGTREEKRERLLEWVDVGSDAMGVFLYGVTEGGKPRICRSQKEAVAEASAHGLKVFKVFAPYPVLKSIAAALASSHTNVRKKMAARLNPDKTMKAVKASVAAPIVPEQGPEIFQDEEGTFHERTDRSSDKLEKLFPSE